MVFKTIFLIFVSLLILICLFKILVKLLTMIRDFIKDYRTMNQYEKDKMILLFVLYLTPFVLILIDANNVISNLFPDFYARLSTRFDVFSFFTTYVSMFANAILLIIINDKERKENTKNLRNSQRPYLDVSYITMKNIERNKIIKNNNSIALSYRYSNSKKKIKTEYLTLAIKNNGASVAILDVNKTKLQVLTKSNEVKYLNLNYSIKRLSIKSGESVYIFLEIDDLYDKHKLNFDSKILKCEVYYKDLFDVNYVDISELHNNVIDVIVDNQPIDLLNNIEKAKK